MGIILL